MQDLELETSSIRGERVYGVLPSVEPRRLIDMDEIQSHVRELWEERPAGS